MSLPSAPSRDLSPAAPSGSAAASHAALAPLRRGGPGTASRQSMPRLSCIVPCYNEAANLQALLPMLRETLGSLSDAWEVILVDDGSRDTTREVFALWTREPGFVGIELSRNFGKEAALTAGLQAASGDAVVMMDADLQHPPALIATMLSHWRHGADVVYAVRANREDESLLKRLGARWFYAAVNTSSRFKVPPDAGDFRLLDRAAVQALLSLPERNRFMKGLYAWVGFDAVAVPYVPEPRASGESHFGAGRLLRLSLDGLTAFTTWPLRAVSLTGLFLALPSMAYGGYLIFDYVIDGNAVSGWTTIVVCLLFFFGVQFIAIGILGEYVARIFEEVKGRPVYIVKRQSGQGLETRP